MIHDLKPDLVLLDVMLPELDGVALLQAMRSDPGLASLHVVIISSAGDREAVMKMVGLGIQDYLLKPFKADLVTKRVGRILTAVYRSRQQGRVEQPLHSRMTEGKAS
jgi:DNA-binding response OmpR family regulator